MTHREALERIRDLIYGEDEVWPRQARDRDGIVKSRETVIVNICEEALAEPA